MDAMLEGLAVAGAIFLVDDKLFPLPGRPIQAPLLGVALPSVAVAAASMLYAKVPVLLKIAEELPDAIAPESYLGFLGGVAASVLAKGGRITEVSVARDALFYGLAVGAITEGAVYAYRMLRASADGVADGSGL